MIDTLSSPAPAPTIHASAVLVEGGAVLIRGPGGAGKSRLALDILRAADNGALRFARLVADDRTLLVASHGCLLASPPAALAGRAGLSQQLDRAGWRSMNAERMALLQSLRDSASLH